MTPVKHLLKFKANPLNMSGPSWFSQFRAAIIRFVALHINPRVPKSVVRKEVSLWHHSLQS